MAKAAQNSNAAASPIMVPARAGSMTPAHAELLEQFQTRSAELAEEFAKKLKHLAQFDEDSPCSTSSSSEHAGSDCERVEGPDDDDNDDEESLSPSANSTRVFRASGDPKPKLLVNGNSFKNSTKLEPKEMKMKKLTVNGISKTDKSENPVSIGHDLSQKVGGMNGSMVNGDSETTDRKERIRSSRLDYKRLDELYV